MPQFQVGEIILLTYASTLWAVLGYEDEEGEPRVIVARNIGGLHQQNTLFEKRFQKIKIDGGEKIFDTPEKAIEWLEDYRY
jgi:hypothetical protein